MEHPVCAIVGVGPGNGAAFARRFAAAGYRVALVARNPAPLEALPAEVDGARAYPTDATSADAVRATFARVDAELGPVECLIYNAGNMVLGAIATTTPETLEQTLRVGVVGCLVAAQQVVPGMRQRGRGQIVVIGATASRRGSAGVLPFAVAKGAQRNLAESMARELGPAGIHVSHVVIDGVIDVPATRARFGDKELLAPDGIAEAVYMLTTQPRTAWTFELDLRPASEKW